jgi:hypothetical protein
VKLDFLRIFPRRKHDLESEALLRPISGTPYTATMEVARHQCMIYEGPPAKHLPGLAQVIREKLRTNHRCLYLNSPAMVAGIRSYLAADGLDAAQEVNNGSLVLSPDPGHLVDGVFDAARMLGMLVDAVSDALAHGYAGLWATGDMTWELGREKNFDKLMAYECGLEEMFRDLPAPSGIRQYHRDTLPDDALHVALSRHRGIYLNQTQSRVNPFCAPADSPPARCLPTPTLKEMTSRLRLQADS